MQYQKKAGFLSKGVGLFSLPEGVVVIRVVRVQHISLPQREITGGLCSNKL